MLRHEESEDDDNNNNFLEIAKENIIIDCVCIPSTLTQEFQYDPICGKTRQIDEGENENYKDPEIERAVKMSLDIVNERVPSSASSETSSPIPSLNLQEILHRNHAILNANCQGADFKWIDVLKPPNDKKDSDDVVTNLITLLDGQKAKSADRKFDSLEIQTEMKEDALICLLGRTPSMTHHNFHSWWLSSFQFSSQTSLGLLQSHGGPCGILAPIQCWIFLYSLFLRPDHFLNFNEEDKNHMKRCRKRCYSNSDITPLQLHLFPCSCISVSALLWAITVILYRATPQSKYYVVHVVQRNNVSQQQSDLQTTDELKNETNYSWSKWIADMEFTIQYFTSAIEVYTFYSLNATRLLESAGALLGVVLSVLLTKGVENVSALGLLAIKDPSLMIRNEVDDIEAPLIGVFGHSSQELVNLFLTGEAVTNVFDGDRDLSSGDGELDGDASIKLRGIHRQQLIGYLTELEAMRYCEVGKFYKMPLFPVWVAGNPNHFTSLFCLDARISRLSEEELLTDKLKSIFDTLDVARAGFISAALLDGLLEKADLSSHTPEARLVLNPPMQGGIILKMEFVEWAAEKLLSPHRGEDALAMSNDPPLKFIIFHYDGQEAGGPSLTPVLVEPFDVSRSVGQGDDTGLALLLRTRWKNTLISQLALS